MDDVKLLKAFERAPLRTLRYQDIAEHATNAARDLARLEAAGAVAKIAHGVYTLPPQGQDARWWVPPVEEAGLAIATVRFGARKTALMGIGAARHWGAYPRAIGTTVVAIPVAGRPAVDIVTGGVAHFVTRDVAELDVERRATILGPALVTTPAQTLYDLLARPNQAAAPQAAAEAARRLIDRVTPHDFERVVARARRVPAIVRATLDEMRADVA